MDVGLREKHSNPVVGGDIDMIIGNEQNGNKPRLNIYGIDDDVSLTLFSSTMGEAKSPTVGLMPVARTVKECLEELKTFGQPVLEVLSLSQKCIFPCNFVPLANIYGNRYCFRPLFYFKELDILLTTPTPIQYITEDLHVVILGFSLLYYVNALQFNPDILKSFETCGWKPVVSIKGPTLTNGWGTEKESQMMRDRSDWMLSPAIFCQSRDIDQRYSQRYSPI